MSQNIIAKAGRDYCKKRRTGRLLSGAELCFGVDRFGGLSNRFDYYTVKGRRN